MRGSLIILVAQAHGLVISRTCVPTMNMPSVIAEEQARKAWLARLDAPAWGGVVAPVNNINIPAMSEVDAKKAWLARLDVPSWGKAVAIVADISKEVTVLVSNAPSDDEAKKKSEHKAKKAWLARLDAPSWGMMAIALAAVSSEIVQDATEKKSEDEAKEAWLARLDAPSWGKAAKMMATVAQEASVMQEMTEACDQGDDNACESLSHEEEAKKEWLARLDVPTWGAAAAAVSAVATQVGA